MFEYVLSSVPKTKAEWLDPPIHLFKSIYPDLKSFKWYEQIIIGLFGLVMICFSILDFNSVVMGTNNSTNSTNNTSILMWVTDRSNGYAVWQCALMTINGLASFTGVLAVVLVSRRKISTFFWGIINNILLGLFSFAYGYAGNAQTYILFVLPVQFIGLYMWYRTMHADPNSKLIVKTMYLYEYILYVGLLVVIGVVFYYEIPAFSIALIGHYQFEDKLIPHILDAVSNSLMIVGNILMLKQLIEQWFIWLAMDCVLIVMYSGVLSQLDFNILVMTCVFTLNAIYGFVLWAISLVKHKKSVEIVEV